MRSDTLQLSARLADLLAREHAAAADFLLALADFDASERHRELGYATLFDYLHRELGLSRGAAHYRKVAARLVRAHPAVTAALRDGRLCITSVVELARVLTPANETEVLPRFFHRSRREAREVAAALSPASVVPARATVTQLQSLTPALPRVQPVELGASGGAAAAALRVQLVELDLASVAATSAPLAQPVERGQSACMVAAADHAAAGRPVLPAYPPSGLELSPTSTPGLRTSAALGPYPSRAPGSDPSRAVEPCASPTPSQKPARDEIRPLTADRFRLHVTVSRRFLSKLEAARDARSHARPGASAEDVLEEALDLLLAREARRREATTTRRPPPARPSSLGRIPAAVRRRVWARDAGCCQWPLAKGGICGSTRRLELDHLVPRALGGPSTPDNLRVLCRAHNLEAARRALGDAVVDRYARPRVEGGEAPDRVARARAGTGGKVERRARGGTDAGAAADGRTDGRTDARADAGVATLRRRRRGPGREPLPIGNGVQQRGAGLRQHPGAPEDPRAA